MLEFTAEEVAAHRSDPWVAIEGKVYDLSTFSKFHPGGLPPLLEADVAGKDCTEQFYGLHRAEILSDARYARLQIGTLKGWVSEASARATKKGIELKVGAIPYGEFRAKRGITLIARGMTLTRLCSHAPVAALLPARVGQERHTDFGESTVPTTPRATDASVLRFGHGLTGSLPPMSMTG